MENCIIKLFGNCTILKLRHETGKEKYSTGNNPDSFWKLEEDGNENKIFDNGWYKAVKKSIDFRSKDSDLNCDPDTKWSLHEC